MKTIYFNISIFALMLFCTGLLFGQDSTKQTQTKKSQISETNNKKVHGKNFVDLNGDGYNDNAPDHDGDGIPNGLDQDYLKLKHNGNRGRHNYIDLDGDGINDNLKFGKQKRMGPNFKQNNLMPQKTGSGQTNGSSSGQQKNKGKNKK